MLDNEVTATHHVDLVPGIVRFMETCSPPASAEVAESLNKLYDGVEYQGRDGTRHRVRCMVTQYQGDWKFHKEPWTTHDALIERNTWYFNKKYSISCVPSPLT